MKKTIIILFTILLYCSVSAQSKFSFPAPDVQNLKNQIIIWEDDFSTNPTWTLQGDWQIGEAFAGGTPPGDPETDHTETNDNVLLGTVIGGNYNPSQESSAISQTIDCSAYDNIELVFYSHSIVETNFDEFYVLVSNDGTTWIDFTENNYPYETEWTEHRVNISEVAGGQSNVQIKFMLNTDISGNYPGISIDDLAILSIYNTDITLTEVYNTQLTEGIFAYSPNIRIYNAGVLPVSNFDVHITIFNQDENQIYAQTKNVALPSALHSNEYTYYPLVTDVFPAGNYTAHFNINFPDDENQSNNLLVSDFTVKTQIPYSYSGNSAVIASYSGENAISVWDMENMQIEFKKYKPFEINDFLIVDKRIYMLGDTEIYTVNGDYNYDVPADLLPNNQTDILIAASYDYINYEIYVLMIENYQNASIRQAKLYNLSNNFEMTFVADIGNTGQFFTGMEFIEGDLYVMELNNNGLFKINSIDYQLELVSTGNIPFSAYRTGFYYNRDEQVLYALFYEFGNNDKYATFYTVSNFQNFNFNFITNVSDDYTCWSGLAPLGTGLNLIETQPPNNENAVSIDETIYAKFSENVTDYNLSNIQITDNQGNTLSGVSAFSDGNYVYIQHDNFEVAKQYTVKIPASTVTSSDNIGNEAVEWSFITQQFIDISETQTTGILLYPNPSNGSFNIKSDSKIVKVEIYDITGKLHKETAENHINISEKGVYIAKIYNINNETYSRKIIVQ